MVQTVAAGRKAIFSGARFGILGGMDASRRLAYLHALGVTPWLARTRNPATDVAPARPATDVPAVSPPSAPGAPGANAWQLFVDEVRTCTRCALHASRTQAVFGVGNVNAQWMFVGEAPGVEEDRQGEPFVGAAGRLLNAMLLALGLKREQVYIANVLKCRPPQNRDPQGSEIAACLGYLQRQIEAVAPHVIVAMGRFAAHSLLKTDLPLGKLRGQRLSFGATPLIVTYHPAYLLRNPIDKRKAWDDLRLARSLVAG